MIDNLVRTNANRSTASYDSFLHRIKKFPVRHHAQTASKSVINDFNIGAYNCISGQTTGHSQPANRGVPFNM
jgi:hypothetical protein